MRFVSNGSWFHDGSGPEDEADLNNNRNSQNTGGNNNRRRGRGNNNRPQGGGGRGEQLNRIDSRART